MSNSATSDSSVPSKRPMSFASDFISQLGSASRPERDFLGSGESDKVRLPSIFTTVEDESGRHPAKEFRPASLLNLGVRHSPYPSPHRRSDAPVNQSALSSYRLPPPPSADEDQNRARLSTDLYHDSYLNPAGVPRYSQPPPAGSSTSRPSDLFTLVDRPALRKRKLSQETVDFLKAWLHRHSDHPYPSEDEAKQLSRATGLSMRQVSNWMINARRRILAPARPSSNSTTTTLFPPSGRSASPSGLLDPLTRRASSPAAPDSFNLYYPTTLPSMVPGAHPPDYISSSMHDVPPSSSYHLQMPGTPQGGRNMNIHPNSMQQSYNMSSSDPLSAPPSLSGNPFSNQGGNQTMYSSDGGYLSPHLPTPGQSQLYYFSDSASPNDGGSAPGSGYRLNPQASHIRRPSTNPTTTTPSARSPSFSNLLNPLVSGVPVAPVTPQSSSLYDKYITPSNGNVDTGIQAVSPYRRDVDSSNSTERERDTMGGVPGAVYLDPGPPKTWYAPVKSGASMSMMSSRRMMNYPSHPQSPISSSSTSFNLTVVPSPPLSAESSITGSIRRSSVSSSSESTFERPEMMQETNHGLNGRVIPQPMKQMQPRNDGYSDKRVLFEEYGYEEEELDEFAFQDDPLHGTSMQRQEQGGGLPWDNPVLRSIWNEYRARHPRPGAQSVN
ncbi:hypothetical protein BT96DRAFT_890431 [Gymnopus androsaceus JB14]|uniref:Homeobox domain-containing protein n=1 Tax=Gymnopus androsaceus JB14 TaxID=1447944 RepID=A0A6A4GS98_9AGAR|nr:hypothetical protein BT96DRAFT_890431 [Gymnopus androsaceus JB14]